MAGGVLRSVGGIDKALGTFTDALAHALPGEYDGSTKAGMEEGLLGQYINKGLNALGLRKIDDQIAINAAPLAYESKGTQVAATVAEGIGEMLPYMIPGAGGAAEAGGIVSKAAEVGKIKNYVAGVATTAQNPGLLAMGMSAMGSGASQAAKEGASSEQAMAYGLLEGAKEYGTELTFGGIPFLGEGIVRPVAANTAKTITGKFAKEMEQEDRGRFYVLTGT